MIVLGPTNRHPRGVMSERDAGELTLAITSDRRTGKIKMIFGVPVEWIGFEASHARDIARVLLARADECEEVQT